MRSLLLPALTILAFGQEPLRDGILVYHYWPGGRALAERLAELTRAAPPLPALPPALLTTGADIHIYLAPDAERLDSLSGGHMPEWGAGLAFPGRGEIILPAYASRRVAPHDLARILRHELAHIALHRHLEPLQIPRWFDEGYARWAAGEWDMEAAWQLRLAFATGRAPPLDSLDLGWPRGGADARVAYLLATSAIAYLIERGGGERGLGVFIARWKEAGDLDTALRRTYGVTLGQLESDWRRFVRQRYGWAFFFSNALIFWLIATILLLVLFAIRRRRDLARFEQLQSNELPDTPAYWLEEDRPETWTDLSGAEPPDAPPEPGSAAEPDGDEARNGGGSPGASG
jgi:hypothetical protein